MTLTPFRPVELVAAAAVTFAVLLLAVAPALVAAPGTSAIAGPADPAIVGIEWTPPRAGHHA